jgi:hypothetical protein
MQPEETIMKTHAYALRAHTISNPSEGDRDVAEKDVFELPVTQFQDFKSVGLVREATKAEIAASKKAPEAE